MSSLTDVIIIIAGKYRPGNSVVILDFYERLYNNIFGLHYVC